MKLFTCKKCGQLLFFENTHCENCGSLLGFLAEDMELHTLKPAGKRTFTLTDSGTEHYRYCENQQYEVCNWVVPEKQEDPLCLACSFNRTIPNLEVSSHLVLWRKLEFAKHRLIYTLLQLDLPLINKSQKGETGLAFNFLAEQALSHGQIQTVLTGHASGLITLNIAEADDAERAKRRTAMGEPYRTLLGHFRHEVGHYYWDRLIADSKFLKEYRQLFGDEQQDYGQALQLHYQNGAPEDWSEHFISAYASAHSWEDWAETWAHYLHMVDTLETAHAFSLRVDPKAAVNDDSLKADIKRDPFDIKNFDTIIKQWLPLTFAMNSINRSMGQADLYPFVIAPPVIDKLSFVHRLCHA